MIKIKNLTKRLGKTYSLSDLNLNIEGLLYKNISSAKKL